MTETPRRDAESSAREAPDETTAVARALADLPGRKAAYRRSVRSGFTISIALHLVLILGVARVLHLSSLEYEAPARMVRAPEGIHVIAYQAMDAAASAPADDAIEVVDIVEIEEPDVEQASEEEPAVADPTVVGPPAPIIADEARPGALTNAERLQPREGDPRLWKDFSGRRIEGSLLDPTALNIRELKSRLSVLLDSLELTEEQRRAAVEWVTEPDEDGDQWGVTADGIHLGNIVIPISLDRLFAAEGPLGRELRQRERDLRDIHLQDLRLDVDDVTDERRDAMRERSDEEVARREAEVARRDSIEAAQKQEADSVTTSPQVPRT